MLKKYPRQLLFLNIYGYFLVASVILLTTFVLMNSDTIGIGDLLIVGAVVAVLWGIWWRFHPRLNTKVGAQPESFIDRVRSSRKHALIALESEYCPMCMAIGNRIEQLEKVDNLQVFRLSINKEPGKSLFKEIDGRVTPTYVLFDKQGNVVDDWPVILPIERILYAVRERRESAV